MLAVYDCLVISMTLRHYHPIDHFIIVLILFSRCKYPNVRIFMNLNKLFIDSAIIFIINSHILYQIYYPLDSIFQNN